MLSRRAQAGVGAIALGLSLALLPVAMASASSHRPHHQTRPKSKKGGSASNVSETCPSGTEISTLTGTTYPAPQSSSGAGEVTCNYADAATGANLVLGFTAASGVSGSELKTVADSQAKAQSVTATPLSGYGNAAYLFTLNDASTNSSGVATTTVLILDGSKLIDITAEATPVQVEAVAHYVLAQK